MFTTFFKMTKQPFAQRIPSNQILTDERMTQAMARLNYMAQNGTMALISGPTGVGKSTLIKLFIASLPQKQYLPVYIHFTHLKSSCLFKLIVSKLGESPKHTKEKVFLQIMNKADKTSQTIILIIDEAHHLEPAAIIDLRLLISSALDEKPPLKIILSGQEDIVEKLKRSSFTDFVHRISVYCPLKPLTLLETQSYIDFQIQYAGASPKIFDEEVKTAIHQYANGVPQHINNIATALLLAASIQKLQKMNLQLLNQTMAEFQLY